MTAPSYMSILTGRAKWFDARWTLALRNWRGVAAAVVVRLKALAPYALIDLILPGGSVIALLLWLYRRRKNAVGFSGAVRGSKCRVAYGARFLSVLL
jgi:hypothetical protein